MNYKCFVKNENMHADPVAIILGGVAPHGEVLKRMKKRGYYTILIDYFPNPPAKEYADVHYQESAMDYETVKNIAVQNKAQIIMSCCLDQHMNIAMKAAEELHLMHPFSSQTAFLVTNKSAMKQIMIKNDIPTPRFVLIRKGGKIAKKNLHFPLMIKPSDNCGSAGITKVLSDSNLEEAFLNACKYSTSGDVVIEEYAEGAEASCHFLVKSGKPHLISIFAKMPASINGTYRNLCSFCNSEFVQKYRTPLEEIAGKIVSAFGLASNTPLFFQAIINEKDIRVFEFSPRLGGGVSSYVNQKYFGYDQIEYSIGSYFGESKDFEACKKNYTILTDTIYSKQGIYGSLYGQEALIQAGIIEEIYPIKMPGDHISIDKPSAARICVAIIKGGSLQECFEKMNIANKALKVLDINGHDIKDDSFSWDELSFKKNMNYLGYDHEEAKDDE